MLAGSTQWLDRVTIDPAVHLLRPDYRALLVLAEGLAPGVSDPVSEGLLKEAEEKAKADLADRDLQNIPHVAAWRDAFRSFGAKPQRTRPSVDALLRRVDDGLPRVDRLTDAYNAVSITHCIPIGGEDADRYKGPPRLMRARGDEPFETSKAGDDIVEHPEVGEVIWRDDDGVTCRRWNWRQCPRTRLTTTTTTAFFVLDALEPMSDEELDTAGQALVKALELLSPRAQVAVKVLRANA